MAGDRLGRPRISQVLKFLYLRQRTMSSQCSRVGRSFEGRPPTHGSTDRATEDRAMKGRMVPQRFQLSACWQQPID